MGRVGFRRGVQGVGVRVRRRAGFGFRVKGRAGISRGGCSDRP